MNKISTRLILSLFFILIANTIFGQLRPAIAWQKCLGGTLEDKANDVLINADGSIIIVGLSKSNDGDVTGHHGSTTVSDAWITKIDSLGNIIWQRSIGGTGEDYFNTVIATTDNAYLCVGYTSSNDGDVSGQHGAGDVWVVKINSNGSIAWSRCYGGSKFDTGADITGTSDGKYAIIGTSYSDDGDVLSGQVGRPDSDGWVFKINESGDIAWEKCLNFIYNFVGDHLRNDIGYNITRSENGSLYALASGTEDFQDNTWPDYDTVVRTPGKLYQLDNNNGAISFIGSMGGDSCFSMCKTQNGMFLSFLEEQYFYPEFCFDENMFVASKADGINTFTRIAGVYSGNCTSYGPQLIRIARTHGISVEPTLQSYIGAGVYGKYTNICCPYPTYAMVYTGGVKYLYGGDINIYGSFTTDAFRSIKIFPSGNEYIAVGHTNSIDGDVVGYHNSPSIGGPSDFWVVKLQALNRVVGNVFVDENNNGVKDVGKLPFNNAIVKTNKAGFEQSSIPYQGFYNNTVATGTFTTTIAINRPYYTATPVSKTSVFTTYKNVDTANFAVHPIPGIQDYSIGMASLLTARPGFNLQYNLAYTNNGTTTLTNKNIIFVKDSRTQFLGALPASTSINGDTIKWNLASLLPMAGGNIIVNLQLATVPTVNNGDIIIDKVLIDSTGDFQPIDNYVVLNETVSGSYDPNNKKESFGGEIYPPDITAGKYLNYTIRFQNSGTDTAFNIILRDTLDPKLNADSIEVVASSHAYNVNMRDKKYLTVTFSNIKLVDSIHNEPLSHGYFSYRIKPLSTVVVGDTIRNSASIYFDFNPPIKTNTEITFVRPTPTTNLWTGAVSTAWEDPLNWGNHLVPDENTNVIINTGLPRYPIINSNAVCKSLSAKTGVNVLVKNGFTLNVAH